jgi:hypothetical protein
MATSEELFISVNPQLYLKSKSSTLMSQAELLHILKRIQNLKVLSRQKSDLRKTLLGLISSMSLGVNSIQSKIPTIEIPKTIPKKTKPIPKEEPKKPKTPTKRDEIEEELILIQAKLRELNS